MKTLEAIENADWETVALSTSPQFMDISQRSRARHAEQGGLTTDDMRRRLDLDDAEPDE